MRQSIQLHLAASVALALLPALHPEEGGVGRYAPGSIASFVDGTPTLPTVVTRFNGLYYGGSYDLALPIAGLGPANVDAESYLAGLTLAWRPPIAFPTNFSYAASITLPYVWVEVSGDVTSNGGTTRRITSQTDALGDIVLAPVMLNYGVTRDFHLDLRGLIYAPTGDYEVGRLANTGKNFWTFSPILGFLYFGQKNGFEASVFTGFDFNTENEDTDYLTGTQFHVDGTLAQHLPLLGGLAGVGVSGYWYDQISGDSGSGATFGDFLARTTGVGPVLSYARKVAGKDLVIEAKWLHEVDTTRRLEGDYVWLKVIFKF